MVKFLKNKIFSVPIGSSEKLIKVLSLFFADLDKKRQGWTFSQKLNAENMAEAERRMKPYWIVYGYIRILMSPDKYVPYCKRWHSLF